MGKMKLFRHFSVWITLICMGNGVLFAQELKNGFPDNVTTVSCYGLPDATAWDIKRTYVGTVSLFDMDVPLVGDIDSDNNVEILAAHNCVILENCYYSNGIYVFNAKTGAVKKSLTNLPYFYPGSGTRAIADVNKDGKAELFIASGYEGVGVNNGYLYCYDATTGTQKWKSTVPYTTKLSERNGANILIVDFNHDGVPEVVVLDKIYNSQTGALLLDMELDATGLSFGYGSGHGVSFTLRTLSYLPAVADMDNDGNPEFVAGKHIYTVNITNASGTSGNSKSILRTVNSSRSDVGDGFTAVADLNLDGYLDVVVTRNMNNLAYIYAWDGKTGNLLNSASNLNLNTSELHGPSIPFLGDLDGDGRPEIAFTTQDNLHAYKYNPVTSLLEKFWSIATTDGSGATTLTMFDFNQDGKTELVYRDQDNLRIINGSKKSHYTGKDTIAYDLSTFACGSYTLNEYPVIADVTGDGHADIITFGKELFAPNTTGFLFLFESKTPGSWAPSRKVWNQYAYNSVNVNNDLTIPKYMFNAGTKMDGLDGVANSSDDVRPYNAFLQQQTFISNDGVPFFMLPDLRKASLIPNCYYYGNGDSLKITIDVKNQGSASIGSPVYCTAYNNSISTANVMAVGTYNGVIQPGETQTISMSIQKFKSNYSNAQSIIVRINDNSIRYPYQQECDKSDSVHIKLVQEILIAQSDYTSTTVGTPVSVNVTSNDILGTCTGHSISINAQPKNGSASVMDANTIRYTPSGSFVGQDSLEYILSCGGQNSIAKVYINVINQPNLPDNFYESDCNYKAGQFNFSIALRYESTVNVDNYCAMVTGDIDGDGNAEIIAMKPNGGSHHPYGSYLTNGFHIFNHDATLRKTVDFPGGIIFSTNSNSVTLADLDNDGKGEIIFTTVGGSSGTNYRLYVYDYQGNMKDNILSSTYFVNTTGVADFNNDGYPEIYSGTNIYRYQGGNLIALYEGNASQPAMAQDIDGDGIPEIVTPGKAFKVKLTSMSGTIGNTVTQMSSVTMGDAVHALADVDLDGQIEVIAVENGTNTMTLKIWDPVSGVMKWTMTVTMPSGGCTGTAASSYPFIGDTDNDGCPDIAFMGGINKTGCTSIYRYEYDSVSGEIVFRSMDSSFEDSSSRVTGLSMFDFNIDGSKEVVYRDQICLYILRGSDFQKEITVPNNCSGTLREYPLIASLTSSGESFILINSGPASNAVGTLRIYGADVKNNGTPWAPARKMWNQFAFYQNTMNDNLKVIKNPAPLNIELTSTDGLNKKMRPFNGHMFQLGPIETSTLEFVHPIADLEVSNFTYKYNVTTNKLELAFKVSNTGDAAMDPAIPVNVYAYKGGVSTKIKTYDITTAVNVGDVINISFSVDNFSSYIPHDSIVVRAGEGKLDCNPGNNRFKIFTDYAGKVDDYYGMYNLGTGATGTFNILANDALSYAISSLSSYVSSAGSALSTVAGVPVQLGYVSPANFMGIDTISYSISGLAGDYPILVAAKSYIYVYPGKTVDCPFTNKSIRINDTKNKVTVDYYSAATGGSNSNIQSVSSTTTKTLFAEVIFNGVQAAFNNRIQTPYAFEIVPSEAYWNKNAQNHNWNDPANWMSSTNVALNTVPMSCTNVHIPGNALNYPSLDTATTVRTNFYGEPVCNNITFHFGGEVARQEFLTYNKAYIQYNFGYYDASNNYKTDGDVFSAVPMNRGRWYALSAPLKKISSGDFSVGGYPNIWQRGFQSSPGHIGETLNGEWYVPDNSNAREVGAAQNYAISIWTGEYLSGVIGEKDQNNLNQLKGILEMPYFENSTVSNLHRIHSYDGTKSSFKYYWYQQEGLPFAEESKYPPGTIVRGQEAYRFIIEDASNKAPANSFQMSVPAGVDVMIGNPFVSSLDFDQFYAQNSSKLEAYYRLYTGSGFTTYPYVLGSTPLVASYQGFFLKTKGSGTTTLDFPLKSSVTRATGAVHQLKAPSAIMDNIIHVGARNKFGSNTVTLALNLNVEGKNIEQMYIQDSKDLTFAGDYMQLYVKSKGPGQYAVVFESGDQLELPLGVVCKRQDWGEIFVENPQNLNAESLILLDKFTGKEQDLLQNPIYEFTNNPSFVGERFVLKMNRLGAPTDIEKHISDDLSVYTSGRTLYVKSDDVISEVRVSSVHGVHILNAKVAHSGTFVHEIPSAAGVYLVTVTLENGEIHTEKVIIN